MKSNIPTIAVPPTPLEWDTLAELSTWNWDNVPTLPPFILADGSGPALQQTTVRVCYNAKALYIRFDCDDDDIWGTHTERDDPIYNEEAVEVFLSPGQTTPTRYYEFEVSPDGVLLDAKNYNPTSQRSELEIDERWNCAGIRWQAGRHDAAHHWWAVLVIPWAAVDPPGQHPTVWRANFYRIERPRHALPEFSCWSPTITEPANFHKPVYFGTLILAAE